MKKSLSVPETARLMNVSREYIYVLLRRRVLQGTGRRRILWVELKKLCMVSGVSFTFQEKCLKITGMDLKDEIGQRIMNGEERLLKLSQVAKILNVSRSVAYDMFHRGDLRGVKFSAGKTLLRVYESSVLELLQGN